MVVANFIFCDIFYPIIKSNPNQKNKKSDTRTPSQKKEEPVMREPVELLFSKLLEANINRFNLTFDQVRLPGLNGMEIVRVDLDQNNEAKVFPVS